MAGYAREYPDANAGKGAQVVDLRSQLLFTYDVFRILFPVLLAAVGFVLLIIWANIGNLFLARAIERSREIAFRITLGASRFRVMRQLMTEALVLASMGAAVGVAIAIVLTRLAEGAIPLDLYRVGAIDLDVWGLSLVVVLSALSAVCFGLAPALEASRADLASAIAGSGRGASEGRDSHRLRSFLVVVESAVALVLVIGALLMVRTYDALSRVDTGFEAETTLTMELRLARNSYTDPSQQRAYFEAIRQRALRVPGVHQRRLCVPVAAQLREFRS